MVQEIRAREIKRAKVMVSTLQLQAHEYHTSVSTEYFLQWLTPTDHIAGFLRLSLPTQTHIAMIREVHVYGVVSNLGEKGQSQHLGLGSKLVHEAERLALAHGYQQLRVISAIGTREYYQKLGFIQEELYQIKKLA